MRRIHWEGPGGAWFGGVMMVRVWGVGISIDLCFFLPFYLEIDLVLCQLSVLGSGLYYIIFLSSPFIIILYLHLSLYYVRNIL